MIALLLLLACTTLSTVTGARPLEPGQVRLGVAPSLQSGGNPLSIGTLPLPQLEAVGRVGISENVDLGARLYLVGAAVDVRYRFYAGERLHLAVAPGLAGTWVPFYGSLSGQGGLEMRVPVAAEWVLSDKAAVMTSPTAVLRRSRTTMDNEIIQDGRVTRLDAFTGAGLRYERRPHDRLIIGLSADLYAQPARHLGPAWSVGLDMALQSEPGRIKRLAR
ncbi:MAG: hypothetical protein H6740_00900 [Alphaproteobacteria bacterium]|nr:hypothetical protein [Alphaproteobacteria bacterium]